MKKLKIALALSLGFGANPASAQYYDGSFWIGQTGAMHTVLNHHFVAQQIDRESGKDESPASVPTNSFAASQASSVALTYSPSMQRRRANLASFVSKSRSVDPQGSAAMEKLFASTDVIAALGRDLAPYGLRTNDVADAYSAYWMCAWQAAHQDTSDPGRVTAQAVRGQAANAIAATPEFRNFTDAEKQEFAEALLVQAALISAAQTEYKDDPAMAKKLAASVRQGARATGIDLDAATLTREGFVAVRKTGSRKAAPGAEPGALAATKGASSRSGYGFLAAAGGAGLGAALLIGKAMARKG